MNHSSIIAAFDTFKFFRTNELRWGKMDYLYSFLFTQFILILCIMNKLDDLERPFPLQN